MDALELIHGKTFAQLKDADPKRKARDERDFGPGFTTNLITRGNILNDGHQMARPGNCSKLRAELRATSSWVLDSSYL